jgi:N-acetylneuraminic acid mutarotase
MQSWPDAPRSDYSVTWTGREMIVWGGLSTEFKNVPTGAKYDPERDAWEDITMIGAPEGRGGHSAVWTGTELIVWGGIGGDNRSATIPTMGGRYDPATDTWSPLPNPEGVTPRYNHAALWTGAEMIIWGGQSAVPGHLSELLNDGVRYRPS